MKEIDSHLVSGLNKFAVAVTGLGHFDAVEEHRYLEAGKRSLAQLPGGEVLSNTANPSFVQNTCLHCLSVDPPQLARETPELVFFGLNERILDIIEMYLGVPPAFTTLHLRRDIGTGRQVGTRLWHLDTEDTHVVRMIVYLTSVNGENGPFEYVPLVYRHKLARLRSRALQAAGCEPIYDEEMGTHVPPREWTSVTGEPGTMILADTAMLYHHGKVHRSERAMVIYTYTSRSPNYPVLVRNCTFDSRLTERQRDAMFVPT